MIGTTRYDILIDYKLQDKASKGLKDMGDQANRTSGLLSGLKSALVAVGAGFAARAGAKAFIGFNSELEKMKIQLSGILSLNMDMPFDKAQRSAEGLFATFVEAARKSPAQARDFNEMANGIASAVSQAGGSIKDLEDLTKGGVLASVVFGTRGDMAALDVTQMLSGVVGAKDRMARSLLASQGKADYLAFNKLSAGKRLDIVRKALTDPKLKAAGKEFGDSFAGQFSTLKDNIELGLGKVGLPLFKAITKELKGWNTWIDQNPKLIEKFATEFGAALKDGFLAVKTAVGWIVQHRETLLNLAKAFLFFKGFNMLGSSLTNIVGSLGKLGENATKSGSALGGVAKSLTGSGGFIAQLGMAAAALGVAYQVFQGIANYVDAKQSADIDRRAGVASVGDWSAQYFKGNTYGRSDAGALSGIYKTAKEKGLVKDGVVDQAAIKRQFTGQSFIKGSDYEMTLADAQRMQANGQLKENGAGGGPKLTGDYFQAQQATAALLLAQEKQNERLREGLKILGDRLVGVWTDDIWGMNEVRRKMFPGTVAPGKKADVNVKIERIEVTSEDPDRFVYGMVNVFESIARNPSQAADAARSLG